jgi:hypothetical protein
LVLGADSEEVISAPPLLRTHREKIRVLETPAISNCRIVLGGSGEYDYVGMIGDFIEEMVGKTGSLAPTQAQIDNCIRAAVAKVWRDYARYEGRSIDVKLLIASRADCDIPFRLTVVSGAAVRKGADIEAIGIGDATFRALADRFLIHGVLSTVSASTASARIFMVHAMHQAKLSIPGVGGSTRIVTLTSDGARYMKSYSVVAIQRFLGNFDSLIRNGVQLVDVSPLPQSEDPIEALIMGISSEIILEYKKLKAELEEIEKNEGIL